MDTTRIITEVQGDKIVTTKISDRKKNKLPSFHGIGGNDNMKTKVKGYNNLYEVLQNLSKGATWLWWGLLRVRDVKNNKCRFKAKDNVEAKKITVAYKELHKHNLIIRVARQMYMINPTAMLPEFDQYADVAEVWDKLKEGTK